MNEQEFVVHFGPHVEPVELENTQSPTVKTTSVSMTTALCGLFDCSGPSGNKFLMADIEIVDHNSVAIGWSGQTWGLRDAFHAEDIPLGEDGEGGYVRFINGKNGDVSQADVAQKLLDVMTDGVLYRTPCFVRLESLEALVADSPVDVFIKRLRLLDHLVFKGMH